MPCLSLYLMPGQQYDKEIEVVYIKIYIYFFVHLLVFYGSLQ